MKHIFIYFFCFLTTLANNKYIPKTLKEKEVLERYRNQEISIGIEKGFSYDEKLKDNQSSNDLIYEIFSDYLGLNVKVVNGNWSQIYKKFSNNQIDLISRISRCSKNEDTFLFSIPVTKGDLYLVTNKDIPFDYLKNLDNKTIYLQNDSSYNDYFYDFLLENEEIPRLTYVDNKFKYKNELILVSTNQLPYFKHSLKISDIPGMGFGIQKSHKDLLPIINNALKEKYIKKFEKLYQSKEDEIFLNKFLTSLTPQESEYLKNLKSLNILSRNALLKSYSLNQTNSHFSSTTILSDILSNKIKIKVNKVKKEYDSWNQVYNDFLKGHLDLIFLAKTRSRMNKFCFTKAIGSVNLYKITNYKSVSKKVGVVKHTAESNYISKLYLKSDIIYYETNKEIKEALREGEIKSGFLYSFEGFNLKKYYIEKVKSFPIYIAVKKENKILRDILNKAISSSLNLESLQNKVSKINRENRFYKDQQNEDKARNLSIVLGLSIVFILLIIHKVFMKNTIIKKLKEDSLTGLPNREGFKSLKNRKESLKGYAILIDIDNFKEINEKYGFKAGDEILIDISKILKETFKVKTIYRVSSDEFYVLFQCDNIDKFLYEIKKKINIINEEKNICWKLSLSIGYSYFSREKNISLNEAFKFADMAMNEAKEIEGTHYIQATEELVKRITRERSIKSYFRIENLQGLYPVFQPKFSVETKEIVGAEALARWKNEELGFIFPGEFIPIAEKIKLIHLIDYKIAEESVKSVRRWLDMGVIKEDFKLSFNISMETFNRDDIVKHLLNLLEMYKVPGKFLEIEVTESIFSSDLNKVLKKIEKLKEKGYEISIDDFTAGHSAATLLSCIPASVIKFDKSILDTIKEGEVQSETIYKNLIALVKDLKMKIVAEGVETEYQFNFLKENSVDIAQGFLLSRPLEEKNFLEKL